VAIKYVIPIVLVFLLISQLITDIKVPYGGYPGWALAIGWGAVIVPGAIAIIASLSAKK